MPEVLLRNLADRNKPRVHLYFGKDYLAHMVRVHKGSLVGRLQQNNVAKFLT